MFVQTEVTPNPNSLKFLPGKNVSNSGSFEITKKEDTDSELVRNLAICQWSNRCIFRSRFFIY